MSSGYFEYLARTAAREKICPVGACALILGAREQHVAWVSQHRFAWLSQWRWSFLVSRSGAIYGRRKTSINGVPKTIMLHNVILEHMGKPRPTEAHQGDHIDHNTLNCCDWNLQWLTPREQVLRQMCHATREDKGFCDIPF